MIAVYYLALHDRRVVKDTDEAEEAVDQSSETETINNFVLST